MIVFTLSFVESLGTPEPSRFTVPSEKLAFREDGGKTSDYFVAQDSLEKGSLPARRIYSLMMRFAVEQVPARSFKNHFPNLVQDYGRLSSHFRQLGSRL